MSDTEEAALLGDDGPISVAVEGPRPETILASDEEPDTRDVHLVLLLHGLYGSPANLWCLEEELAAVHNGVAGGASGASGDEDEERVQSAAAEAAAARPDLALVVLNAKSYVAARTWDGIDVNAQRVAEEVGTLLQAVLTAA